MNTRATDAGLAFLADLPNLTAVKLDYTKASDKTVKLCADCRSCGNWDSITPRSATKGSRRCKE